MKMVKKTNSPMTFLSGGGGGMIMQTWSVLTLQCIYKQVFTAAFIQAYPIFLSN